MGQTQKKTIAIEALATNLSTYAIDRDDLKALVQTIPKENDLNMATVEYELQILRILSVGWAIAFYLPQHPDKERLSLLFWEQIREVATKISTLLATTSGQSIDYFSILKERLDGYVRAMQSNPDQASEPTVVMGPAFATACNCPQDPIAILVGTKMFTLCLGGVKSYIDSLEIETVQ
ncbi:hypothetical protein HRM2_23540 [Desulforapulum autotrophicum HRM2]|uniref:Uncharacterized protein n=1 Tax=Desulforapulum autotrophicum (strain ATCC 43914 / DSM 3382 / VKM B-1955 / HRM2) TaxID=177437 RepID=C0QFN1_DESAH|nr:hypothetical protein [Desulforapulum autotrophicum]ACN15449.1 hypothetical protein HRM2_23540 [Desulforapulum autotrophicum HRM2]